MRNRRHEASLGPATPITDSAYSGPKRMLRLLMLP